jgi:hypothetical protein
MSSSESLWFENKHAERSAGKPAAGAIKGTREPALDEPEVVSMDPAELLTAEPFTTLFPIDAEVRDRIVASMRMHGFDPSKPINVWREKNLIIDGHTRYRAAKAAGVQVRVCFHDFASEDEALDYAIANQRDRRNITDAQLTKLTRLVDQRREHGGDRKSKIAQKNQKSTWTFDPSAQETAKKLNTSPNKIKKIRAIDDHAKKTGDTSEQDAVDAGAMSVNRAYQSIRSKKKGDSAAKASTPKANGPPGAHETRQTGIFFVTTEWKKNKAALEQMLQLWPEAMRHDFFSYLEAWGKEKKATVTVPPPQRIYLDVDPPVAAAKPAVEQRGGAAAKLRAVSDAD